LYERYSFDAEYVRRLQSGDPATEDHFSRYFGDLVRIKARVRLRCGADVAEDIRQETLLRVLRSIRRGGVASPERLGAFVSGVCSNVILENLRGNTRFAQFPEEQPDVPSGEPSAESGLLRNERIALVREAMERLSSRDQELLRRVFLEEEDVDAVCAEFQITREYLRVLLHRARIRLKTAVSSGRGGN
jgi:RNA polymerase sigma-70 factor (ECF subfamily)